MHVFRSSTNKNRPFLPLWITKSYKNPFKKSDLLALLSLIFMSVMVIMSWVNLPEKTWMNWAEVLMCNYSTPNFSIKWRNFSWQQRHNCELPVHYRSSWNLPRPFFWLMHKHDNVGERIWLALHDFFHSVWCVHWCVCVCVCTAVCCFFSLVN